MTTAAAAQEVLAAYREALHAHDGQALLRVYADDAVVLAYSERNRPASPQRIEGRQAIDDWLTDVMSRNLTHTVSDEFAAGDRFAFRETCVYPSGENVVGTYVCKVRDGQIVEQIGVEAWDE
jgi:ketosteroid isomerase-like protein